MDNNILHAITYFIVFKRDPIYACIIHKRNINNSNTWVILEFVNPF